MHVRTLLATVLQLGLILLHASTIAAAPTLFSPEFSISTTPATHNTPALVPRIYGGTQVQKIEELPFLASIVWLGLSIECTGTILSETQVLTAANCLSSTRVLMSVRVGSLRARRGGTSVGIKSWKTHPKFDKATYDYDVAILTLKKPLVFSSTIAAATLVQAKKTPQDGEDMTIAGWGDTKVGGSWSKVLLKAQLDVVGKKSCQATWASKPTGTKRVLTDRQFCAAAPGLRDALGGDGGGPIFDTRTKVVRGSVSGGYNNVAASRYPGVYADYANEEIAEWIRKEKISDGSKRPASP